MSFTSKTASFAGPLVHHLGIESLAMEILSVSLGHLLLEYLNCFNRVFFFIVSITEAPTSHLQSSVTIKLLNHDSTQCYSIIKFTLSS